MWVISRQKVLPILGSILEGGLVVGNSDVLGMQCCSQTSKLPTTRKGDFMATFWKPQQDNKSNFCCNFGQLLHQFIIVKVHIISDKNVRSQV